MKLESRTVVRALLALALAALPSCTEAPPGKRAAPVPAAAAQRGADAKAVTVGVASFNMAWAGTLDDFKRHLEVCGSPSVDWCDTRARWARGTNSAPPEEEARAKRCQEATVAAAGGRAALGLVAPCGAYRAGPSQDPASARRVVAYQAKLAGLEATVARLIEGEGVSVIAFQEVRSKAVIETVLGRHRDRFEVCDAPHTNFQTVAFAWDRAVTERPGVCTANDALAVGEVPGDAGDRRVRPGLALELTIRGEPVTFLNVHLKAGCASIVPSERFPARLLTDPNEACQVLNRQVPILESWLEAVSTRSPRMVWLGDLNRRIEEEAAASIASSEVRADGSDPAGTNRVDAAGKVSTRYLWQEVADGSPVLHQVPLSSADRECRGFEGLDHVVISDAVAALNPAPIPSRKVPVHESPGQSIQTSDHCPRVVQLRF